MTKIEWTHVPGFKGETWNPVVGCAVHSAGCTNCYAMRQAHRIQKMAKARYENWLDEVMTYAPPGLSTFQTFEDQCRYVGTTDIVNGKPVWTGKVRQAPESTLIKPPHWRKPRCIFVNSMGDLFHEDVPDAWIDQVFAVMALCPEHIFIILTKRSARMREYFQNRTHGDPWAEAADYIADLIDLPDHPFVLEPRHMPLPNVWLGVSVEDQKRADERIPDLLDTPAAKRLVSCEPLLGPVDLTFFIKRKVLNSYEVLTNKMLDEGWSFEGGSGDHPGLDWVFTGGESGPGARPSHPDCFRSLRDQCAAAGVPFLLKQWGEWAPQQVIQDLGDEERAVRIQKEHHWGPPHRQFARMHYFDGEESMMRIGKKKAGNMLDGVTHLEFPEVGA